MADATPAAAERGPAPPEPAAGLARAAVVLRKLATPIGFVALLPLMLARRLWHYRVGGGRAEVERLRASYAARVDEYVGRLREACGAGVRVELQRVPLEGALLHANAGEDEEAGEGVVTLEAVVAGEEGRPLAVLLHGFPDTFACFELQAPALVAAGYRVVMPNLRGYGRSDRPAGWRNYRAALLARDVALLAERMSPTGRAAVLGGHDWGGQVAWLVAHLHRERVERLFILNSPHPVTFRHLLTSDAEQAASSWYILFYQVPALPELLTLTNPAVAAAGVFSRADGFTDADRALTAAAWVQPRSFLSMLNYYRAMARGRSRYPLPAFEPLDGVPVVHVWGVRDRYLVPAGAGLARPALVPHYRAVYVQAGHFSAHGDPEGVKRALLDLAAERVPAAAPSRL